MNKLPWFPFYGRDFFFDEQVKLFSLRQIGVYLHLLWHQWEHGSIPELVACQSFPAFRVTILEDRMHSAADAQGELDRDVEDVILSCFVAHQTLSDRFYNKRLEAIRQEQLDKSEVFHLRAKKAAKARQAHEKQSLSNHQAIDKRAIQSQSQIEKKKDNLKSLNQEKSVVSQRLEDRSGTGFTPLVDAVVTAAKTWPKEIP